jgi:RsiW-degrading membrane proteinase PrsW (M82 family)
VEQIATIGRGIGLAAGGAIAWLMYFDLKDRLRPEPRRLLLAAFVLGGGAALLGLGLYNVAEWLGAPRGPGATYQSIFIYCVLLVGPLEEGVKFLVARFVVFRWRHFDEPIDGLVYAAAVAIGFATVENVLYAQWLGWLEQIARSLVSPLTHSLFAAIWGLGTAHAFFSVRSRAGRIAWQAGTLVVAMILHGLYDFVLLAGNATYVASALTLVVWLGLIGYARRLVRGRGGLL